MLDDDELTKGTFLGFSGKPVMKEVDLCVKSFKKSQGDGDVDFSKPSIQRQSIRTFS